MYRWAALIGLSGLSKKKEDIKLEGCMLGRTWRYLKGENGHISLYTCMKQLKNSNIFVRHILKCKASTLNMLYIKTIV